MTAGHTEGNGAPKFWLDCVCGDTTGRSLVETMVMLFSALATTYGT